MTDRQDGWTAGSTYEDFMGRWSRQLAPSFVSWLKVPSAANWLDVGCGTGALTGAICEHANPASVLACDPAEPFVQYASRNSKDERASFAVAGVGALPRRDDGYDCVTSLLALNFFPDHAAAVREMASLVRPGGVVSACVWDYAGKMEFLRYFWEAVIAEDANASHQDEGVRFPICSTEALSALFERAGLTSVTTEAIDVPTSFASFDDYWQPLLGGAGPAAAYVASLDDRKRQALAKRLRHTLPGDEAGRIDLVARSWAVRGTVS